MIKKIQLYDYFILFEFSRLIKYTLYNYISYIQKILFYKKILSENKCYGILQEKKLLYFFIKDIIELIIKNKEKKDIKNSTYICNRITIKDFDIFFGNK